MLESLWYTKDSATDLLLGFWDESGYTSEPSQVYDHSDWGYSLGDHTAGPKRTAGFDHTPVQINQQIKGNILLLDSRGADSK